MSLSELFAKIKPKIYKKRLFIGKREVIRFTAKGIKKVLHKIIWIFVVIIILATMIFGGFVLFVQSTTPTTTDPTLVIPYK